MALLNKDTFSVDDLHGSSTDTFASNSNQASDSLVDIVQEIQSNWQYKNVSFNDIVSQLGIDLQDGASVQQLIRMMANPNFSKWLSYYDSYMSKIKPYEGTEYYDRLKNNPYIGWQSYNYSLKDRIGMMFGADDPASAMFNDRQNQSEEYFSNILKEIQQNRYNSTSQQVARDAAAGINDTLSGDVANSTPAADAGIDQTSPIPGNPSSGADSVDFVNDAQQAVLGFCQGILSMAGSIQSLGMGSLTMDKDTAGIGNEMYKYVLSTVAGSLPMPEKRSDGSYDYSTVPVLDSNAPIPSHLTPRQARLYKSLRASLYDSKGKPGSALQRAWRENVEGATKATKGIAEGYTLPGFDTADLSGFFGEFGDKVTKYIISRQQKEARLVEMQAGLASLQQENAQRTQEMYVGATNAQNQYTRDYYNGMDGSYVASQDMSDHRMRDLEREYRRAVSQYNTWLAESRKDLVKFIRGKKKWYNNVGMVLLPGLLQTLDSGLSGVTKSIGNMIPNPINIIKTQ